MIYALLTLLGVVILGGVVYYVSDVIFNSVSDQCFNTFGITMLNPYSSFTDSLFAFMPWILLIIGVISALVIELRRRNPDAYISF